MKNITYVTSNYGKYISVKEKFEEYGIEIKYENIDTKELDINDIELISREKARQAYSKIGNPVFVADSGFYIRSYPNKSYYPGAFVKRSGVANNIEKVLNDMIDVEDRYCYFLDCLTYYDGEKYIQFFGKSEGFLSKEIRGNSLKKAKSKLWYIFIPKNFTKTLAEMTDEERNNRNDDRTDATFNFIEWLKNNQKKDYNTKVLKK